MSLRTVLPWVVNSYASLINNFSNRLRSFNALTSQGVGNFRSIDLPDRSEPQISQTLNRGSSGNGGSDSLEVLAAITFMGQASNGVIELRRLMRVKIC
jgi:hypothetical protein